MLQMEHKLEANVRELKDPTHDRKNITLTREEEIALVEAIVEAEDLNIWSLLMPAVYQLVPGSMIAKLWYNAVFPPGYQAHHQGINFMRRRQKGAKSKISYILLFISYLEVCS